jgi:hypothetical protein
MEGASAMGRLARRHTDTANSLGLRAARRMALQSATVPADQVDETYYRETEFLGMAVDLAASHLSLACDRRRSRFEAVVRKTLDLETDRILAQIAKGPRSPQ